VLRTGQILFFGNPIALSFILFLPGQSFLGSPSPGCPHHALKPWTQGRKGWVRVRFSILTPIRVSEEAKEVGPLTPHCFW